MTFRLLVPPMTHRITEVHGDPCSPLPFRLIPSMKLANAPYLGIERFANSRNRENWSNASDQDKSTIIRAVYQQVLGNQYVMQSEKLDGAESLFRTGYLNVRELVRMMAKKQSLSHSLLRK